MKGIKISLPNHIILQDFEQMCDSLFRQINKNNKQNMILSSLRDTLLPKLMSGELSVEEVSFD